jgi:hypothetical protein
MRLGFIVAFFSVVMFSFGAMSQGRNLNRSKSFVDIETRYGNKDWVNLVGDKGFTINDASFGLAKDFGDGNSALVDLAFNSSQTPAFDFSTTRSQAYIQITRSNVVTKVGQFDTIFGVEANDSRDRLFANMGAIKAYVHPLVHAGAMVTMSRQKLVFRGLLGNPPGKGAMDNDDTPEFGVHAHYANYDVKGGAGILLSDSGTGNNRTNLLIDITGGMQLGSVTMEACLDYKKTSGFEKATVAAGVFGTMPMNDIMSLVGRFELLKEPVIGGAQLESALNIGAGASYRLATEVQVRGDLSVANIKPTSDQKKGGINEVNPFSVGVSLVAGI